MDNTRLHFLEWCLGNLVNFGSSLFFFLTETSKLLEHKIDTNVPSVNRDELEIYYVPHKYPQNPEGCPFFATKARHLTKEERAAKSVTKSSSAPAVNANAYIPAISALRQQAAPVDITAHFHNVVSAAAAASQGAQQQQSTNATTSSSPSAAIFPPPAIANMLVVRMLKQAKLQTVWDQAELFRTWLSEYPEYSSVFEQLVTEKYQARDKAKVSVVVSDSQEESDGEEDDDEEEEEEEDDSDEDSDDDDDD